jgi:hypothetical protein
VDKAGFVYSVNGLRVNGSAGKALYRSWTDRGQKGRASRNAAFCTLDPVDMQAFFHSAVVFMRFCCSSWAMACSLDPAIAVYR